MYQQKIEPFGPFKKYTFFHSNSSNSFSLVPEHGACVLDLTLQGKSVLDGHQSPEALASNDWGKSALLFPFPNRLKNGSYIFDGKNYQFPINDTDLGNALHGFGLDQPMTLDTVKLEADRVAITCSFQYMGDRIYYPFPFFFEVRFRLSEAEGFSGTLFLRNEGERALPVGLGWHPYFALTERVDDTTLHLPPAQLIEIDAAMIPTGNQVDYHHFDQAKQIDQVVLDNGFALPQSENKTKVVLSDANHELHYWQDQHFPFLQVFTPPHRRSIALEPMTCNIDAFNNGDGLAVLAPGARLEGDFGCWLERKK